MSDENTPSLEPEVVNPTLDDVINEFSFDPPEQKPVQQQQTYQQQTVQIDPFNEQQVNQYFQQFANGQNALQSELQSVSQKLNQYEQRDAQRQVEADIQKAVETISKKVEGVDPLMIELYLEKVARENTGFRNIWENRNTKPQALNKALGALTTEIKDKFLVKADPQLAENQRAMSQFKPSAETSSDNPFNESWDKASEAERDRMWANLKSS